ncbi:DUF1254 domain-containing protein [Silvanigrella aquatica]|uniref:DUF1254 domain-containing protein n=1 Tax=Silvanigrella aquatica TaxID=1915309 RepID=A0A1L4D278_9BACT|nr:DUF1254 domain-containing protein [Silvanigrella aquatica]APJ04302.1 hypothetical protein AXG55_10450 [Silvanigrella aquatica]
MRIYMFKKFINFIFLITINTFLIYHSYAIHFNELSESQIENIVKRSYQYVALYNVINKVAMATDSPISTKGWNKLFLGTKLANDSLQTIARANSDTLYSVATLDLRNDPMILEIPFINSKYVSLQTSSYDNYMNIIFSKRDDNYKKSQKILFYSARTKNFNPMKKIKNIDQYVELSGDFGIALLRVLPHFKNQEKYHNIVQSINQINLISLSNYLNKGFLTAKIVEFPHFSNTDIETFGNNFLEVMQFILNHTTFQPEKYQLDKELLESYQAIGIEPKKIWNPKNFRDVDLQKVSLIAQEIKNNQFEIIRTPEQIKLFVPYLFLPKGFANLDTMLLQSVMEPLGLPQLEQKDLYSIRM